MPHKVFSPHNLRPSTLIVYGYTVNHEIFYESISFYVQVGLTFQHYISILYCPLLDEYFYGVEPFEADRKFQKAILKHLNSEGWAISSQCGNTAPHYKKRPHGISIMCPEFEGRNTWKHRNDIPLNPLSLKKEILLLGKLL